MYPMWNNGGNYNMQNPFGNQYNQTLQPMQQAPRYEVIRVHGEGGVDAFQMGPNCSALLMDETAPLVWLKQTDGAGFASKTAYKISVYIPGEAVDVTSLEQRISALEAKFNDKSDSASNGEKRNAK